MPTIDVHFDGSTACLGRDGWFQLGSAMLEVFPEYGELILEFRSRNDMSPPQVFCHLYNPEELRTLICGLAKALAQMTTKED